MLVSHHPLVARLLPRLATQLVPAALVTVVGALVLGNLARTSESTPTAAAPVQTAITAEAVFTATPREAAAPPVETPAATPRPMLAAKPTTTPTPPRKLDPAPRQVASAPVTLPTVEVIEPPKVAAAEPQPDPSMMGRLRSATASVIQAPRWAAQSMASWFREAEPPRPPATVPQNFQASM